MYEGGLMKTDRIKEQLLDSYVDGYLDAMADHRIEIPENFENELRKKHCKHVEAYFKIITERRNENK